MLDIGIKIRGTWKYKYKYNKIKYKYKREKFINLSTKEICFKTHSYFQEKKKKKGKLDLNNFSKMLNLFNLYPSYLTNY